MQACPHTSVSRSTCDHWLGRHVGNDASQPAADRLSESDALEFSPMRTLPWPAVLHLRHLPAQLRHLHCDVSQLRRVIVGLLTRNGVQVAIREKAKLVTVSTPILLTRETLVLPRASLLLSEKCSFARPPLSATRPACPQSMETFPLQRTARLQKALCDA